MSQSHAYETSKCLQKDLHCPAKTHRLSPCLWKILFCAEEDYEHMQTQANRLQALAGDHQQHVDEVSESLAAWAERQRSVHPHPQLKNLKIAPWHS